MLVDVPLAIWTVVTLAVSPVFRNTPPPDEVDRAMVMVPPTVVGLPLASCRWMVRVPLSVPATWVSGELDQTSFVAAPAVTVKVTVPGVSVSPLEAVPVIVTASAFDSVRPGKATEDWPARIVRESVPAKTPVPVVRLRSTTVSATTGLALPKASCELTVRLNAEPAVTAGGVEKASLVAAAAVMLNAELLAAVRMPLAAWSV